MKKHPADYLPSASPEFHLRPSFGFQREGRGGKRQNHELERGENVLGSGPFKDISSFTHLLKICSTSRYKTLIKTGACIRGFRGEVGQKAEG